MRRGSGQGASLYGSGLMKVLIAGGGIGGLTTALSCAHFGHDVIVLEQADVFDDVGAGIQVPPNAMKVFRALGLADRIGRDAVEPTDIQARMGRSGRTVFTVPLRSQSHKRWGATYLHLHRADYIAALHDSLSTDSSAQLRLGATVANIEQDETSVSVTLNDGSTETGDLLIGADGIHSVVREWKLGPDQPVFTGNVAWRATVPINLLGANAPDPTACVWMGSGRHAVTYQLRSGQMANFVGVVERNEPVGEGWSEQGSKTEALSDFAGWHPVITRLIDAVPDDTLFRWALYDRPPLARWTDGRVALLGDAAHPMLPFLAQGAAMAVEDAWVLATAISDPGRSLQDALKIYAAQRLPRTSRVQARSRANAKTFHKRTLPAQVMTYGPMWLAGQVAPSIIRSRLDWLHGHDVTTG